MNSETLNKFQLTDRVVILTGGAGFLGRQYTRAMLSVGAIVYVVDLHEDRAIEAAEAAAQETGGKAFGLAADIRSKAEVAAMVDRVVKQTGRIDILVNNAAIDAKLDKEVANKLANTFEDYPLELWQQTLDANLTGTFLCCQSVGKVMVSQQRGVIVNVASTYGVVAPDQRLYQRDGETEQIIFKPADYAVTKAGVIHLTRYLATYWADKNIRVNSLTPHGVYNSQDEQFLRRFNERSPMRRMAHHDEMNAAMLFLVSDASSYMTGSNLVVDGGWTAW